MTRQPTPDPETDAGTEPQEEPRKKRGNAGTHLFLASCMALVGVFLTWATVGELDVVSLAMGEVVPAGQVKSVQHLEGGIVRKFLVKEGDPVTQGQALIELEPTWSGGEVEELKIRLAALEVSIGRLEAEMSGQADLTYPAALAASEPDLVSQAKSLFRTRRNRVENQLATQREEIVQKEQEIMEVKARMRNNTRGLDLVREQLKISNKLIKLDLTNRMAHLDLLKEESSLQGRIEEDRALLPRAVAAQNAAKAQLKAIESGFREEAAKELADARRTHKELSQRIRKSEDSLRRTVLRAPVDGIVKTLYVVTVGGVVQAGKTVLDIVPGDDRLLIEARLQPQDIDYVRVGQEARVQLASGEAARYGTLSGKVVHVSPDTIVTREGSSFYKVRIVPEKEFFERGTLRYRLSPGMQVQSSIQTGTRTVMRYLLDPYIGQMNLALKER